MEKDLPLKLESSNTIVKPPKDVTLANRPGKTVTYQSQDGMKRLELWTIKNQKAYIATYTAEVSKFDKYFKQADKMIESITIN